jgi:hypothetical protein
MLRASNEFGAADVVAMRREGHLEARRVAGPADPALIRFGIERHGRILIDRQKKNRGERSNR